MCVCERRPREVGVGRIADSGVGLCVRDNEIETAGMCTSICVPDFSYVNNMLCVYFHGNLALGLSPSDM